METTDIYDMIVVGLCNKIFFEGMRLMYREKCISKGKTLQYAKVITFGFALFKCFIWFSCYFSCVFDRDRMTPAQTGEKKIYDLKINLFMPEIFVDHISCQ